MNRLRDHGQRWPRRLFRALCALLLVYALVPLAVAVDPRVARLFMERFHLRTESFALWALTQPVPWMYNFESRALITPRPLSEEELAAPEGMRWYAVNHQPTSVMTFVENRAAAYPAGTSLVYLETRYRDQQIRSLYMLTVASPGSDEPWRMERVDPPARGGAAP